MLYKEFEYLFNQFPEFVTEVEKLKLAEEDNGDIHQAAYNLALFLDQQGVMETGILYEKALQGLTGKNETHDAKLRLGEKLHTEAFPMDKLSNIAQEAYSYYMNNGDPIDYSEFTPEVK